MAGELLGKSITSVTSTTIDATNYITLNYTAGVGEGEVPIGSYVALREFTPTSSNGEFEVLQSVIGQLVINVIYSTGVNPSQMYIGPNPAEFTSWIVPSGNPNQTELSYMSWDLDTLTWVVDGLWSSVSGDDELPIIRHNFTSDAVTVTLRLYEEGFNTMLSGFTAGQTLLDLGTTRYIPLTGGVRVFKGDSVGTNFSLLTPSVDYIEVLEQDLNALPEIKTLPFSTKIQLRNPLLSTDVIRIVYVTSELLDTVHYNTINSNIIQFIDRDMLDIDIFPNLNNVSVWGLTANEDAQNPAHLLDKEANTVVTAVQIWDPARGDHYTNAIHNIDLLNNNDPASYNVTDQMKTLVPGQIFNFSPWTDNFVGTTWLDTTNLQYRPYYDLKAIPELEERLRAWGQLTDWGQVQLQEWVKSDVPPSEWDALALQQEGDVTIPEGARKSGTAKLTLFELVNTEWIELKATVQEFDVVVEGIDNGNDMYSFVTTDFVVGDIVDVYINGKIHLANFEITSLTIQVEATIFDRIRVMKQIPIDGVFIAAEIEAGRLLEAYQYVDVLKHDDLGIETHEYFFWVTNKGTKPDNKERTDSIGGVTNTLENIPVPYMFFHGIKIPSTIEVEGDKLLSRIEQHTTTIGQVSITTELPIAPETEVFVFVGGVAIPSANISYEDGGRIVDFPSNPQPGGSNLELIYTGLYDETINLPTRFTQMVSRGLRGVIDADRRYTLRYTRDFTLRDDLDVGSTPLELKDLHAEWEMFREQQPYHINRDLWNKITESIIQRTLADSTIRVPSYERELYDDKFGTSTQYGLGLGQAFVNGTLALSSILADLENPDNNFQPIDINVFFDRHNFDTIDATISAMDTIYNTYSFEHVNRIFFSVLHDALSTQTEYADLIKTSMVSLHGIRPFQINGVFDD